MSIIVQRLRLEGVRSRIAKVRDRIFIGIGRRLDKMTPQVEKGRVRLLQRRAEKMLRTATHGKLARGDGA